MEDHLTAEVNEISVKQENDDQKKQIRIIQFIMVFYGIGTLIPNAAILTDMDYFIDRLPEYKPDFVFNMVMTLSMVIG